MAATYPELFAAGTAYSGVPAGCFMSSSNTVDGWNATCAEGDVVASQSYWTQVAEAMYPGYSGARPKMQIYHGTADTILYPPNYNETIKEWTGVFGYSLTPQQTLPNTPLPNYTKYIYGPEVQGIYVSQAKPLSLFSSWSGHRPTNIPSQAVGVGHTVPIQGDQDLQWFGLGPYASSGGSTPTTTAPAGTSPTATKTTPVGSSPTPTGGSGGTGGTVAEWGQCGGIGYSGATACAAPYTCHVQNSYYSQCY